MRHWLRIVLPKSYMDRQRRAGFLFVLPALLFFGSVFLLPLAQSVAYSFYRTVPGGASQFVGLRLYEKVFTDSTFWAAVYNTVQLLFMSVPTVVVCSLAVALGLNRIVSLKWRNVWAAMYFLPFACSLVAAVADLAVDLSSRLRHPELCLWAWSASRHRSGCRASRRCAPRIAAVNIWVRIGFDTMIFLAALQSLPAEYYEAAGIDGASAWQRLRHITLPLLNPQILMVCILEMIFNFKIFDQVYATTQGGPASASQTVIMLLYDTAFKYFRFGDASVIAVFVFVTLLVVTLVQWRIFRKPVEY